MLERPFFFSVFHAINSVTGGAPDISQTFTLT